MTQSFEGAFVISWLQTEVGGYPSSDLEDFVVGMNWAWRRDALRVDNANSVLKLRNDEGPSEHLAQTVREVRQSAGIEPSVTEDEDDDFDLIRRGFVVSDGHQEYLATVIDYPDNRPLLIMFTGKLPPRGVDLWVTKETLNTPRKQQAINLTKGVGGVALGTKVTTPDGERAIEMLRAGDLVLTQDSGPQPLRWIGMRHYSGEELYLRPHMRPLRISHAVSGGDLVISPLQKLVLNSPHAARLFWDQEVLVTARDIETPHPLGVVDLNMREVTYFQLAFETHQIWFANGIAVDSFHPVYADWQQLGREHQEAFETCFPEVCEAYTQYGGPVRKVLDTAQASLLGHRAA